MNKIRVSAVSYTNTKPFVYGLKHSAILDKIDLSVDIPSVCAAKLISGQVDVGLVPVAALADIPGYQIISDYCIGASGAVDSVFIFSDKPIAEIRTIALDTQSRTSNYLARILLKNYWHTDPEVVTHEADAFVQIGDRTFGKAHTYSYCYDLADAWQQYTGLPFVFAVWAANKALEQDFIDEFNAALRFGLSNLDRVIADVPAVEDFDIRDYLTNKIDYHLTADKQEALKLFQTLITEL